MKKFVLVFIGIALVYIFSTIIFINGWEQRGQFGDMFGGLNSLFSGLAFLGLIYTILMQKEELSLQRQELKLTREEFSRSTKAQEASEKALRKQAESLRITAKINGLNSVLQVNSARMEYLREKMFSYQEVEELRKESELIKKQILEMIENK